MIEKPQRRALGDWAVESLYDRIFTGALAPGADLGEEHLCQLLDVSRATVGFALSWAAPVAARKTAGLAGLPLAS